MKFIVATDWQETLRAHKLDSVAAVYALETGIVVKRAATTEVRQVTLAGRTIFIKKYWTNSPRQLWSGALRGAFFGKSKVRCEYENMERLRAWGLDAPAPVAYGEDRHAGWLVRSCLLSEAIPAAVSLDELIVRSQARSEAECRSAVPRHSASLRGSLPTLQANLADYVRRLHERGFVHHDLYWRNIILSGQRLDHFYLIDMHKGQVGDDRAQDLATLDAPAPAFFRRTERLRFLLRYRQHAKLTDDDKQLIRRTLALAEPMRERQLKRVREAHR